ncbi:hypothetical protein PFFVO_06205 [Plasmodium falciparum Vietnam Oak-Knoll (FVO)]|uniref:Uncharacterized protein n=2 Tax=Plasmodium falciparum TaxID=5833 RepID=W7K887_PLAFO|nr:hypothetical protein PFFVO_06205 [Plasmodium falciparum Vietnam Oak-Knoll (FVO)]EWC89235.1 hypothetical protein PFNF54_01937 [Plasmodium falciparum NF54]
MVYAVILKDQVDDHFLKRRKHSNHKRVRNNTNTYHQNNSWAYIPPNDDIEKKKIIKNEKREKPEKKKKERKKETANILGTNNKYSILNYFDLKKKDKKIENKKDDLINNDCKNKETNIFKDSFYHIKNDVNKSKDSIEKYNKVVLKYIKIITKGLINENIIKEKILKLLILLKHEDIYLKKFSKKIFSFEMKRKYGKDYGLMKKGEKKKRGNHNINIKEKIYINNIYNNIYNNICNNNNNNYCYNYITTITKYYINNIKNNIYEYKVTYCKKNNLLLFQYYDGQQKAFKISQNSFYYLLSNDNQLFCHMPLHKHIKDKYDVQEKEYIQQDMLYQHTKSCTHIINDHLGNRICTKKKKKSNINNDNYYYNDIKNKYIYTLENDIHQDHIKVNVIHIQNKTENIQFVLPYKPIRMFYSNNFLFFVNIINKSKDLQYFTYSIYNNNHKNQIRIVYVSAIHPLLHDIIVDKNNFSLFKKCKYFYEEEKLFIWTDMSLPKEKNKIKNKIKKKQKKNSNTINQIPNINIIHINTNVNICIAYENTTETYLFFHISFDIIKYNNQYLKTYLKKEENMNYFITFQHFLSIEANNFVYKETKQKNHLLLHNINFNTETYTPQIILTCGGNKTIQNKIKLCLYDNNNNLLFLIPIYHKYVKDKIKIIKNVLNFSAISMCNNMNDFHYFPYNLCVPINNKINTTQLNLHFKNLKPEQTVVNVSTSNERHIYFSNILKKKMDILKTKEHTYNQEYTSSSNDNKKKKKKKIKGNHRKIIIFSFLQMRRII